MTHKMGDGHEVEFDLSKLTIKEYRALFDPSQPHAEEYATLAKVTGLKAEDIEKLPLLEWRKFYKAFLEACSQPLDDPN